MGILKKNIDQFNRDTAIHQGYCYTTDASYSSIVANRRLTIATCMRIPKNTKTLLDIGCGDGSYSQDIKEVFPCLQITGIDAASKAVDVARERYPQNRFAVADVTELFPFTEIFDVAVIRGLLHHTSDPAKVLRNAAKSARVLIVIEPNGNNPILKLIEKVSPYHRAHEERSFSPGLLKRWCREAVLKVTELGYVGFVPFFFPTVMAKIIYFFQPLLEKIPIVRHFLSAQIVIVCESKGLSASR